MGGSRKSFANRERLRARTCVNARVENEIFRDEESDREKAQEEEARRRIESASDN